MIRIIRSGVKMKLCLCFVLNGPNTIMGERNCTRAHTHTHYAIRVSEATAAANCNNHSSCILVFFFNMFFFSFWLLTKLQQENLLCQIMNLPDILLLLMDTYLGARGNKRVFQTISAYLFSFNLLLKVHF